MSSLPPNPNTVDVLSSLEKGNFAPILIAFENSYISPSSLLPSGYSILHYAASFNEKFILKLLLNLYNLPSDMMSKNGQTALMAAGSFGFLEIANILIEKGANIDQADESNFTPLTYSIKNGKILISLYLIGKGARIDISDNNGCNLAHWASYRNNSFLLHLLIRLGVDPFFQDFYGLTPFQRGIQGNNFESLKVLNSYLNGNNNNNHILSTSLFGTLENECSNSSNTIFGKTENPYNYKNFPFNSSSIKPSPNDASTISKNENFNKCDFKEIKNKGMINFLRGLKGEVFLEGSLPDKIQKGIKKRGKFALFLFYVVCLISKNLF